MFFQFFNFLMILLFPLIIKNSKSFTNSSVHPFPLASHHTSVVGVRQSLVKIYTFRENKLLRYGTGILLNDSGWVLTQYHIIDSADNMLVKRENHVYSEHEILGYDAEKNLLLLKFKPSEDEVLNGISCFTGLKPEGVKGWICYLEGELFLRKRATVKREYMNTVSLLLAEAEGEITEDIRDGIMISDNQELLGLVSRKKSRYNFKFVLTLCPEMKRLRKLAASENEPLNIFNLMEEGKKNYFARDHNQAVNYFLEVIRKDTNFADGYYFLGAAYYKMKEWGASNYYFEKSLEKNPGNKEAFNMICLNYYYKKEYELAEKFAIKSVSVDYQYPNPYLNLGSIYQKTDRDSLAVANYQKCLALKPNQVMALCNIGIIYEKQENYKDAFRYYNKVLEIDSLHLEAISNLGNVYLRQDNYSGAIRIYKKAIKRGIKFWVIHYNLGVAYYFSENYMEALYEFEKASGLNKNDESIHYFIYLTNANLNNRRMARKHKKIALALYPAWRGKSEKEILEEIK